MEWLCDVRTHLTSQAILCVTTSAATLHPTTLTLEQPPQGLAATAGGHPGCQERLGLQPLIKQLAIHGDI